MDADRDISDHVLAFKGDRTSAAAGAIFAELDRRERVARAEAELRAARAAWQERVELNRMLDDIVADAEETIVEIEDDQQGRGADIFRPGEAEKLGDEFDRRDIDAVMLAEARKLERRDHEFDKLEGLRDSDYDEFHRQGGSDRLLELMRGED
jgi:hypothetical protein